MGRPKGNKNKKANVKNLREKSYSQKKIHPIKKDDYLDLTKKKVKMAVESSKRMRYNRYIDKVNDWRATVSIVGAITIVVFFVAMGLILHLII